MTKDQLKHDLKLLVIVILGAFVALLLFVAWSDRAEAALLGDEPVTHHAYTTNERTADAWQRASRSAARTTSTTTTTAAPVVTVTVKATPKRSSATSPSAPSATAPAGDAKAWIYNKESGNDPTKVNSRSGACGIGQAYPCSKLPCELTWADYACQDNWFTGYMQSRYGTWEKAKAFHLDNGWW